MKVVGLSLPFFSCEGERGHRPDATGNKAGKEKQVIKNGEKMNLAIVLPQIFNGLSLSSILLMVALGLGITFGIMGVINFAHGEFLMMGAYTTYLLQKVFHSHGEGFSFLLSLPLAFLVAALMGLILERFLIRFLYGRPYEGMLATWGLSLILQQAARNIFGANNVDVASPVWLGGGIELIKGVQLPINRIFIIAVAILCVVGMYLYIYKTSRGRRMGAVMQNRDMAACLGIRTRQVDSLTFAIGCGLAGIAGSVVSLLGSIGPSTGQNYIIDAFMVVVLGGVGKLSGTIAGAIMIGEVSPLFEFMTTSSMGKVIVFALVIAFLQWKPSGLFSLKTRALEG